MEIRRGYVKWTDEDGVFHKEPLHEHPELLAKASAAEQIAAEEVRRLNEAAEEYLEKREDTVEEDQWETLGALQEAPDYVLTTNQLTTDADGEIVPVPEEPITSTDLDTEEVRVAKEELLAKLVRKDPLPEELWSEDHEEALVQLERETS